MEEIHAFMDSVKQYETLRKEERKIDKDKIEELEKVIIEMKAHAEFQSGHLQRKHARIVELENDLLDIKSAIQEGVYK